MRGSGCVSSADGVLEMRGPGMGFTNPVGTGGVCDVCLCLGGVGGVSRWVASFRVWEGGLCYVYVCCESGLIVKMASPGICVLCSADTCAS